MEALSNYLAFLFLIFMEKHYLYLQMITWVRNL